MQVFGWWANYDGCAYYRIIKPLEGLTRVGVGIDLGRILPAEWPEYDAVVGQRVCMAEGNTGPAHTWLEVCKDSYTLTVYEIDDDLFNLHPKNPGYDFFNDPNTQGNIKVCAANSDIVTVSTEPLRNVMLKYNPNVRVVPNFISEDLLDIQVPRTEGVTIIGWAGSATHDIDFQVLGDSLTNIFRENDDVRFMSIGANYGNELPRSMTIRYPWSRSVDRLYSQIARFDIGIAPLKPSLFNESKSWIKALEYAALGIPVVASNFGPYKDFVQHEKTGFLVDTPEEWEEAIRLLVNSEDLRVTMGRVAREYASRFTIEGNIGIWKEVFEA